MSAENVIAQVLGGAKKVLDNVTTVGQAREQMGLEKDYAATVNGEAQSDDYTLRGGDFVSFSRKVKGGN